MVGKDRVKPEKIRGMIPDPHGLLPRLSNQTGAYSKWEKGLLFCYMVVCHSQTGGGTLFTFITGRPRDGVSRISQKLKGLDDLPLWTSVLMTFHMSHSLFVSYRGTCFFYHVFTCVCVFSTAFFLMFSNAIFLWHDIFLCSLCPLSLSVSFNKMKNLS